MSRALIDIPADKLDKLDLIAKHMHVSRASLIRDAINQWLDKHKETNNPEKAFGLLKNKKLDSLAIQNQLRNEWE